MTEKQRVLFSEILIANLEFHLEKDVLRRWRLARELKKKKTSLRRSMGVEAYEKFVRSGKKAYQIKMDKAS
jgi:hypothetical protein